MKKIIIFGTGNAGRAIYRKLHENNEIVAFLDNNKDMVGKKYDGVAILSPDDYKNIEFDYIAYSGVWHKQMRAQLENLGVDSEKIKHIPESELIYTNETRQKAVDEAVKKIDEYLMSKKNKLFYRRKCWSLCA